MEKLAELGLFRPDLGGLFLLGAVMLTFIVASVYVAKQHKGRSAIVWTAIASSAQLVAIILPLAIASLTGIITPEDLWTENASIDFGTLQLFAEMSVVAGVSTLFVLSFLTQTKWKTCPACDAKVPWRAKICPACASSLAGYKPGADRREPGEQPRLKARTIHLSPELDQKLKLLAMPKGARPKTNEDAAISKYVRQLLEQFEAEAKRIRNK